VTIVVPTQSAMLAADSAVSLARYAKLISMPECSFWGVFNEDDVTGDCREIWSKQQRDVISKQLAEAQEELESEIGYFLSPRYVVGTLAEQPQGLDRYVDDQVYTRPLRLRWPKLIMAGVRATSDIALGTAVDLTTDPAQVGPVATTVTDASEISLYHPGSEVEINPSTVTIAAGLVTLLVPRCRLVAEANADNPSQGWPYADDSVFESTVDIKRVYTDPSVGADLVLPHACGQFCLANNCAEHTVTACIYGQDPRLGIVNVARATYSSGAWGASMAGCCPYPTRARLHYLSGMLGLTRQAEDAIVRLAHSKMPTEPCGCQVSQFMWKRDRNVPDILTRERINCPFGLSDGAFASWMFALSMRQWRGAVL